MGAIFRKTGKKDGIELFQDIKEIINKYSDEGRLSPVLNDIIKSENEELKTPISEILKNYESESKDVKKDFIISTNISLSKTQKLTEYTGIKCNLHRKDEFENIWQEGFTLFEIINLYLAGYRILKMEKKNETNQH